jgi:hypothetical protein
VGGIRTFLMKCINTSIEFVLTETRKMSSFMTMPSLTSVSAHVRQLQEWDELFFPILLTAQIWHPLTTTCLML